MIFSSVEYVAFFLTLLVLMIVIKSASTKKGLLLFASYFFYAYWDARFTLLMLALTLVNYVIGLRIEGAELAPEKKRWLVTSVVLNLAVLGFFKYFNFFIDSANHLVSGLGVRMPFLEIILPVGISFIVFEVMSYTIDIYRGSNRSAPSFVDLALLVAFFPHLIAGPILKPREFLPQLQKEIVIRRENVEAGAQIFLLGLAKKVLIADRLAPFVDTVFSNPGAYSGETVWLAVVAYAIQIYCDFSGYSDMAIGSAKCLGFDIPLNFNMPYLSKNITEFWRRWHISLSTWLREYLYIALGGNRKGEVRTYVNLMVVMLLGGLWHGASWNFVVWGALHGGALAIHKLYQKVRGAEAARSGLYEACSWFLTMLFVCVAWVFFRSADFSISWLIVQKMFFLASFEGIRWHAQALIPCLAVLIIAHYVGSRRADYITVRLASFPGLLLLMMTLSGLAILAPTQATPFIYFQF